jgi:hypothetical protein
MIVMMISITALLTPPAFASALNGDRERAVLTVGEFAAALQRSSGFGITLARRNGI